MYRSFLNYSNENYQRKINGCSECIKKINIFLNDCSNIKVVHISIICYFVLFLNVHAKKISVSKFKHVLITYTTKIILAYLTWDCNSMFHVFREIYISNVVWDKLDAHVTIAYHYIHTAYEHIVPFFYVCCVLIWEMYYCLRNINFKCMLHYYHKKMAGVFKLNVSCEAL